MTNIKLICLDLDGTLTDGIYQVSNDGTISKNFHTRDFYALELAQKDGFNILIITSSEDEVIDEKIKQLPINCTVNLRYKKGIKDKLLLLTDMLYEYKLSWSEVAYMGDADNDADVMRKSAIAACPADSTSIIKEIADFIASQDGGRGAVYEFIKWLLNKKNSTDKHLV